MQIHSSRNKLFHSLYHKIKEDVRFAREKNGIFMLLAKVNFSFLTVLNISGFNIMSDVLNASNTFYGLYYARLWLI